MDTGERRGASLRLFDAVLATTALSLALFTLAVACGSAGPGVPPAAPPAAQDRQVERSRMVEDQIKARDIRSERVLDVMRTVPRHLFVPARVQADAYGDSPLPIGYDQTISQPYIVAFMTEALDLRPEHRVLEIGTVAPLADRARETLAQLGYRNVEVRTGNGYLGWPEHAPYDRIMVTAAPEEVPPALLEQLKIDGLMAIPVGPTGMQELRILRRTPTGAETMKTLPVLFVPMTGKPKR
jgi:protein-L-isoaspartate(D-aspartate) O-methyltransferase